MDESTADSGWGKVFQDLARYGLSAAVDAEFKQPFQLERDKTLAQDAYGRLYLRGTPAAGINAPVTTGAAAYLPWIIGGVALLAVVAFLVKD